MTTDNFHIPVLSNEAIRFLINDSLPEQIIVDGTLGGGGYTKLICNKLKDSDRVVCIDKDLNAVEFAKERLRCEKCKIIFLNANFADLQEILIQNGITKISGLVLDLGLSSFQLESEAGFSFMKNTPLDMRAFKMKGQTASQVLNSYSKDDLIDIFKDYGEIGNSERLVKSIIKKRRLKKFQTTFDLVELVKEEYRINKKNSIDFLAKIFQSLRIEVNDELRNLERSLNDSMEYIQAGGRIVIVSYHSLEDRIVKNFFREESSNIKKTDNPFFNEDKIPRLKILTKKPVVPSPDEIRINSRSRSAKLRAAEIL